MQGLKYSYSIPLPRKSSEPLSNMDQTKKENIEFTHEGGRDSQDVPQVQVAAR